MRIVCMLLVFTLRYVSGNFSKKVRVGTVLFTEADNLKSCWSDEDYAMLTSRMIFQDLLPIPTVLNIQNDQFITGLIEYFRMVVEMTRKSAEGKARHVLLLAVSDAIGGYIHHLALPLAKHSYYCGNVKYESVERMYELYNELKVFLRTDGTGWMPPIIDFSEYKVDIKPIPMQTTEENRHPCDGLIFYEHDEMSNENIYIPLPFFDSKTKPHSIALPFKSYSLRSLQGRSASFILVKYYMAATKCLTAKNVNRTAMAKFFESLDVWIHSEVMIHLNDEKFYSGFGGVYRILETLKRAEEHAGVQKRVGVYTLGFSDVKKAAGMHKHQKAMDTYVPLVSDDKYPDEVKREYVAFDESDSQLHQVETQTPDNCTKATVFFFWDEDHTKSLIVVLALLIVLLLWICILISYLCYRSKKKKKTKVVEFDNSSSKNVTETMTISEKPQEVSTAPKKESVSVLYKNKKISSEKSSGKESDLLSRSERMGLVSGSGHMYPVQDPTCHAACSGNMFMDKSTDISNKSLRPTVFGYDYQGTTSTETSPRGDTSRSSSKKSTPRSSATGYSMRTTTSPGKSTKAKTKKK